MREIRFRGRCEKESRFAGQWVEGSLIQCEDGVTLIQRAFSDNCKITYHVEPDTVCQFTGLKDYNGKDLYEGDIVSFSDSENLVIWDNGLCSFLLVGVECNSYYIHCDILDSSPFYIIGNKFDKKE